MTAMADRIDIISAERVRDELTKLLLADRPRAGLDLLVAPGWPTGCCPSCRRCGWSATSTTGTRTSTSTA